MIKAKIANGIVHKTPTDLRQMLTISPKALATWQEITPLARNEWICWITSAKQPETQLRRITVGISKLEHGMKRPCCWAGCPHR